MNKILTISIPTWNRSFFLKELLDILISQIVNDGLSDDVEIVISNNGSEDNTHEVVSELKNQYSFISYNRNSVNIGGNPNVMKSMQLASSEYLLFLGDDDRIQMGSLKKCVSFLKSHRDAGLVVDSSNFTRNKNTTGKEIEIDFSDLLKKYYWNIGNAGVFIVKSVYVKECIEKYGLNFFNQCWSQTQFMILGLQNHKGDKIYLNELNIVSHSVHTELTIYTSYYLWRAGYYELFASVKSMEAILGKEILQPAYEFLKSSINQFVLFNTLQAGVFIDSDEIRHQTRKHMLSVVNEFSFYEMMIIYFVIVVLWLPVSLSRFISNVFIYIFKGKAGIRKKNDFVVMEREKEARAQKIKSIAVRKLEFEADTN